jgi:hypothetical protein
MRDRPTGSELLHEARRVLQEEVVPELGGEARFKVLMVANAMAMAMRELEQGEAPAHAEYEAFLSLYGETRRPVEDSYALEELLLAFNQRFADEIRRGERDGEGLSHRILVNQARARVLISNPRIAKAES